MVCKHSLDPWSTDLGPSGMVPDEGVCFLFKAPAQHVTEVIHRVSLVTAQVNALFWFTQWSTHVHITLLRHLRGGQGHPPCHT